MQRGSCPSRRSLWRDPAATDTGFPLVLVLAGVAVPLGLAFLVGKPILGYARHRRHPTSVA